MTLTEAGKTYVSRVTAALVLVLGLVLAASAWAVYDVFKSSWRFVAKEPFYIKILFVWAPLLVVLIVLVAIVMVIVKNWGKTLTIKLEGLEYARAGSSGSLSDYLRIPWKDLHYKRRGAGPLGSIEVGDAHRKEVLLSVFFPEFAEMYNHIENRESRGKRAQNVASRYFDHVTRTPAPKE